MCVCVFGCVCVPADDGERCTFDKSGDNLGMLPTAQREGREGRERRGIVQYSRPPIL